MPSFPRRAAGLRAMTCPAALAGALALLGVAGCTEPQRQGQPAFYRDLLAGVARGNSPANLTGLDPALPVLLIAGDADGVGDNGRGVRGAAAALRTAGLTDVTCVLSRDARHALQEVPGRLDGLPVGDRHLQITARRIQLLALARSSQHAVVADAFDAPG